MGGDSTLRARGAVLQWGPWAEGSVGTSQQLNSVQAGAAAAGLAASGRRGTE